MPQQAWSDNRERQYGKSHSGSRGRTRAQLYEDVKRPHIAGRFHRVEEAAAGRRR